MQVSVNLTHKNGSSSKTDMPCADFKDGMSKAFRWYETIRSKNSSWNEVEFKFRKD